MVRLRMARCRVAICAWVSGVLATTGDSLDFEIDDHSSNPLKAPMVAPWKSVPKDSSSGGMWTVAGDLDGDGQVELVSARNMYWWTGPHTEGGSDTQYACSIIAQKLDGTVLWRWGNPGEGRRQLSHDVACQVYDWNDDGKNEVVVIGRDSLQILEGATGEILHSFPVPPFATDCVLAADLTGGGRPIDFILKDRYFQMWGIRSDGKILWESPRYSGIEGEWHLGHYPYPVDINGDGKDEVYAGFFMLNSDGTPRWNVAGCNHKHVIFVHCDSIALMKSADRAEDWRFAFTYCSGAGVGLVDGNGIIQKELTGAHYEAIAAGTIFPDLKAPQLAIDIDHLPYGESRIELLDGDLNPIGCLSVDYGRLHALLDWDGDGYDDIVVADNGGIYNYRGEKLASLNLGGDKGRFLQVADYTGDQVKDILIVGSKMDRVYIFKNEKGQASPGIPLGTGMNFSLYRQ